MGVSPSASLPKTVRSMSACQRSFPAGSIAVRVKPRSVWRRDFEAPIAVERTRSLFEKNRLRRAVERTGGRDSFHCQTGVRPGSHSGTSRFNSWLLGPRVPQLGPGFFARALHVLESTAQLRQEFERLVGAMTIEHQPRQAGRRISGCFLVGAFAQVHQLSDQLRLIRKREPRNQQTPQFDLDRQ